MSTRALRACAALAAFAVVLTVLPPDTEAVAAPSNDAFAAAIQLGATKSTHEQTTGGATVEPGEPLGCGDATGATVWFKLVVSSASFVNFTVVTDGYTPTLAVYSGSDVGSLTPQGCKSAAGGNSQAIAALDAPPNTYYFQVGGRNGGTGQLYVRLEQRADPGGSVSGAVIPSGDCNQHVLPRNDDGSTSAIALPFPLDFYGEVHDRLWVNNNGNVTFDGPLSTFTPFGLEETQKIIIAPFFADVDTRPTGSDTVKYGYGETLFEGHRAFCVNWVNVGYYNNRADKLNSFQLLLVEREDAPLGSFDIVFNYDRIQWETGSASGGVDGFGGSSARAGFSNGTGEPDTFYELPGSGVNGAFLDSSSTGLRYTGNDQFQQGRHIFRVRSGNPPPTRYVAIGDSYSSGEGAYDYFDGTDTSENRCHRSRNAYAPLLVANGTVDMPLDFWACSGARTWDVYEDAANNPTGGVPYTDPVSMIDRIDGRAALVTVGLGGNDMGFADILKGCVIRTAALLSSCEGAFSDDVASNLDALTRPDSVTGLNKLESIYDDIARRSSRVRILAMGYPRWYVPGGQGDRFNGVILFPAPYREIVMVTGGSRCAGVRIPDQRWINDGIASVNEAIRESAHRQGVEFVDINEASTGHELCSGNQDFMNGIVPNPGVPPAAPESYHPTAFGHRKIADVFRDVILRTTPSVAAASSAVDVPERTEYTVLPDWTVTTTREVPPGARVAAFNTRWPGSDVVMTLVSPSGRVISRANPGAGVAHRNGDTHENYIVFDPEPGEWTVQLFGAVVAPWGEATTLSFYAEPIPNEPPVALIDLTRDGDTITVDASESFDPDGEVVRWEWYFDDGTHAEGQRVTHEYTEPGSYVVQLVVTDNEGKLGFKTLEELIEVGPEEARYEFAGFFSPVANAPVLNEVQPGRAIPVRFSLGGDHGPDIFAEGSPRSRAIDCDTSASTSDVEETVTAGASELSYSAGNDTYTYVWKTERAWSGSCRELVLALDDGSQHRAVFRFR